MRLAADQGHADAQYRIGIGCFRRDYAEGIRLLRLAANQGHVGAQYDLGQVLARHVSPGSMIAHVPPDYAEAIKWYELAAKNGHPDASERITIINRRDHPTPAAMRRLTALATGDAVRQYYLRFAYCELKPQDYVHAHMWFSIAAANGHQLASESRDIIEQRMTQAQIAEAQKLAREWKPKME